MPEDMQDSGLNFDLPKNAASVIKVIGVGGGGSNAVNHMKKMGINGVDFIVCNTDAQALDNSPVTNRIQLGKTLTEGLGAGANPDVGRQAAKESIEDVREILEHNTKMLFITAGMGGGTGTGAAPVIAKLAKEMGILTVGIVTKPFKFEGNRRAEQAQEGIDAFREHVDSLIVINNDKLREVYGNLGFRSGFAKADEVLATAAKGIAEVITYHYTANIDLRDVKTVLENSGTAIMGSAVAGGANRATDAVKSALDSPLLNDNHIHGAQNVLLLIVSGSDEHEITMDEMGYINDFIQKEAGGEANVIMGIGINEDIGANISITIIATGFPTTQHGTLEGRTPTKVVHSLDPEQPVERAVHEQPLRDIESPDKPMKRKANQPDLFSEMEPKSTVVHDLYDEQNEEEELQEPEAEVELEKPLAPTLNTEESVEEKLDQPEQPIHVHQLEDDVELEEPELEEPAVALADDNLEPAMAPEAVVEETEQPIEEPILTESIGELAEEDSSELTYMELDEDVEANEEDVLNDVIPPIIIDEAPEMEVEESTEFTIEEEVHESFATTNEYQEEDKIDEVSFELDDIEGDGIELVHTEEPNEPAPVEMDEDVDPFDFTIDQVMGNSENDTERISLDLEPEPAEEETPSPVAEANEPTFKRHTLEDLQELEERLSIKKPLQESSEPTAVAEPEEDEALLQFEVKAKAPAEIASEDTSETEFLNKPISPASMKKIQERKKMLEQYSHQWRNDMTDMLEKEPAYKRQGLDLGAGNYSQKSSLGDMTISGEGNETELKSNNSFLHDNVD